MTMAYVSAGIALLSASIAGVSTMQQAQAQKDAADYQAQVDANNAAMALNERNDAIERGKVDAQKSMQKRAQVLGEQRAALSVSGVDVTQGSAVDVLATTQYLGQNDVATIQSNAAREAWGYDVQASNYNADANLKKNQAKKINPAAMGAMAAGSSLLSSAASYAGSHAGGKAGSGAKSSGGTNLTKGKVDFSRL